MSKSVEEQEITTLFSYDEIMKFSNNKGFLQATFLKKALTIDF